MNFQDAMKDPSSHFSSPSDILSDPELYKAQKIKLLRQWEYDAREMEVATEENMGGRNASRLPQILDALNELGAAESKAGPTKQG